MPTARLARASDLPSLLALFEVSEVSAGAQPRERAESIWRDTLAHAWTVDCHHVLMQSGRADPRVHGFYEAMGFQPGLRTAYAASRPAPRAG